MRRKSRRASARRLKDGWAGVQPVLYLEHTEGMNVELGGNGSLRARTAATARLTGIIERGEFNRSECGKGA